MERISKNISRQLFKRLGVALFVWQIVAVLALNLCLAAEVETFKADLDKDGKTEIITAEDNFDTEGKGKVTIYDANHNRLGSFTVPYKLTKVELIDLDKDGSKQIAAWSQLGALYTKLVIYGYKNGRVYRIFEIGSEYGIEADFKAESVSIKAGRFKLDKEGRRYSRTPDWEIWVWNGKEFYR